jgi:hypothetical protein
MPRGSFASMMGLLGVLVPACYTVYWIREVVPQFLAPYEDGKPPRPDRIFDLDCRATVGARVGDEPKPIYVESSDFYDITGCRPLYSFGNTFGAWKVRIQAVPAPLPQLRGLDENLVGHGDELAALCRLDGASDVVCSRARRAASGCRRAGTRYLSCGLSPADRDALLGRTTATER